MQNCIVPDKTCFLTEFVLKNMSMCMTKDDNQQNDSSEDSNQPEHQHHQIGLSCVIIGSFGTLGLLSSPLCLFK